MPSKEKPLMQLRKDQFSDIITTGEFFKENLIMANAEIARFVDKQKSRLAIKFKNNNLSITEFNSLTSYS